MTALDREVVALLLAGEHPVLAALREQWADATVTRRGNFGHIFALEVAIPTDFQPLFRRGSACIDDLRAEVTGLNGVAEFELIIAEGLISCLRGTMWTREWWPEDARLTRVFFVTDADGKVESPDRDLGRTLREVLARQAEPDRPFLDDLPDLRDSEYGGLTTLLVPQLGPADTVQGEVLRAALRVTAEFNSSGCGNWRADPGFFDRFVEYLLAHLCDGTFGNDAEEFVRDLLGRLQSFGNCDYDRRSRGEEIALGKLMRTIDQFALAWCRRHPDLIPRQDPDGEGG